jgi:hypothetical protein
MAKDNVVKLEKKREVSPITNILLAEHERREFVGFVPHGVTIDDVLKPSFWAHVAQRFVPFRTYIDVIAEDSSWVARLLVTGADRNWATVHKIYHHQLTENKQEEPESDFEVNFAPQQKWRIIRKSDREVIQKDIANKDEAIKWLKDYEQTIKG